MRKNALGMTNLRKGQGQRARKGVRGTVVRVLAPGRVAEPARRPVQAPPRRVAIGKTGIRKERRDPAMQAVPVAGPSALA